MHEPPPSLPLDRARAALLPVAGLAVLAGQRCRDDVLILVDGGRAWLTWPAGDRQIWEALLGAAGAEFFESREGHWYQLDHRMPRFDVPPPGEPRRLDAMILPTAVHSVRGAVVARTRAALELVPSSRPRPVSAIRLPLAEIVAWAEAAPSAALSALRGAVGRGRVLVRGECLPPLAGERFWGERVLAPLGLVPAPGVAETALREAAGVSLNELLVLTREGAEAIAESAFEQLSRARLRLASGVA